jgi:hypothetical protein
MATPERKPERTSGEEYRRFEDFARKLLRVPKHELDKKLKKKS